MKTCHPGDQIPFFNMAGEMDLAVRWGTILHLTGNQFSILLLKLMQYNKIWLQFSER